MKANCSRAWLIILPNNPGDVMMGLQVAGEIKAQFPIDLVDFVVDKESTSLVENTSWVNKVWEIDRSQFKTAEKFNQGQINTWIKEFVIPLIKKPFYRVVNLFQDPYAAYLCSLLTCPDIRGLQIDPMGKLIIKDAPSRYLFAIPANRSHNSLHVVDIYKAIAGIKSTGNKIYPLESDAALFNLPSEYAVFQIGSAWQGKKWSLEKWTQLASSIKTPIILIGAPNELNESKIIENSNSNVMNLVGKTKLIDALSILSQASVLISGDTFAMHGAAAVGCPTIALFGPSNPIETGPYGLGHKVISYNANLSEVLNLEDDTMTNRIQVSDVVDSLSGALNSNTLNSYRNEKNWQSWDPIHNIPPQSEDSFYEQVFKPHLQKQLNKTQNALANRSVDLLKDLEEAEGDFYKTNQSFICVEEYSLRLNAIPFDNLFEHFELRSAVYKTILSTGHYTWLKDHLTVHHSMAPGSITS